MTSRAEGPPPTSMELVHAADLDAETALQQTLSSTMDLETALQQTLMQSSDIIRKAEMLSKRGLSASPSSGLAHTTGVSIPDELQTACIAGGVSRFPPAVFSGTGPLRFGKTDESDISSLSSDFHRGCVVRSRPKETVEIRQEPHPNQLQRTQIEGIIRDEVRVGLSQFRAELADMHHANGFSGFEKLFEEQKRFMTSQFDFLHQKIDVNQVDDHAQMEKHFRGVYEKCDEQMQEVRSHVGHLHQQGENIADFHKALEPMSHALQQHFDSMHEKVDEHSRLLLSNCDRPSDGYTDSLHKHSEAMRQNHKEMKQSKTDSTDFGTIARAMEKQIQDIGDHVGSLANLPGKFELHNVEMCRQLGHLHTCIEQHFKDASTKDLHKSVEQSLVDLASLSSKFDGQNSIVRSRLEDLHALHRSMEQAPRGMTAICSTIESLNSEVCHRFDNLRRLMEQDFSDTGSRKDMSTVASISSKFECQTAEMCHRFDDLHTVMEQNHSGICKILKDEVREFSTKFLQRTMEEHRADVCNHFDRANAIHRTAFDDCVERLLKKAEEHKANVCEHFDSAHAIHRTAFDDCVERLLKKAEEKIEQSMVNIDLRHVSKAMSDQIVNITDHLERECRNSHHVKAEVVTSISRLMEDQKVEMGQLISKLQNTMVESSSFGPSGLVEAMKDHSLILDAILKAVHSSNQHDAPQWHKFLEERLADFRRQLELSLRSQIDGNLEQLMKKLDQNQSVPELALMHRSLQAHKEDIRNQCDKILSRVDQNRSDNIVIAVSKVFEGSFEEHLATLHRIVKDSRREPDFAPMLKAIFEQMADLETSIHRSVRDCTNRGIEIDLMPVHRLLQEHQAEVGLTLATHSKAFEKLIPQCNMDFNHLAKVVRDAQSEAQQPIMRKMDKIESEVNSVIAWNLPAKLAEISIQSEPLLNNMQKSSRTFEILKPNESRMRDKPGGGQVLVSDRPGEFRKPERLGEGLLSDRRGESCISSRQALW